MCSCSTQTTPRVKAGHTCYCMILNNHFECTELVQVHKPVQPETKTGFQKADSNLVKLLLETVHGRGKRSAFDCSRNKIVYPQPTAPVPLPVPYGCSAKRRAATHLDTLRACSASPCLLLIFLLAPLHFSKVVKEYRVPNGPSCLTHLSIFKKSSQTYDILDLNKRLVWCPLITAFTIKGDMDQDPELKTTAILWAAQASQCRICLKMWVQSFKVTLSS